MPAPNLFRGRHYAATSFARLFAFIFVFVFTNHSPLTTSHYLYAASQINHTSKTDWQSGILVNATWYPETQLQLDWEGSATGASTPTTGVPWLDGWKFRRRITINNSLAYGLSGYQVFMPVNSFGSVWDLIRSSAQANLADFRFTSSTSSAPLPYWIEETPWNYRKSITINNPGSALNDFQIFLSTGDLGTSALISAGKLKTNYADIMFTDQGGNNLPFWIDPSTNTARGFWIKISTITTGDNGLYMLYGSTLTSLASNGDEVFDFFDDFESGYLNKYYIMGGDKGTWAVDTAQKYAGGYSAKGYDSSASGSPLLKKNLDLGSFVNEMSVRLAEVDKQHYPFFWTSVPTSSLYWAVPSVDGYWKYYRPGGYVNYSANKTYSANTWYNLKVVFDSSQQTHEVYVDYSSIGSTHAYTSSGGYATGISTITVMPGDGSGSGQTIWIDNFRIRKYAPNEPGFSSLGVEEDAKIKGLWVKVSSAAAGNADVYLYYGNSSAVSGKNGDDTFEFFDDFAGASLNTDKWEVNVFGSAMTYEVNNYFRWKTQANTGSTYWIYDNTDSGGGHRSKWTPINNCVVEYKTRQNNTAGAQCGQLGVGFHGADGLLSVFLDLADPTQTYVARNIHGYGFIEATPTEAVTVADNVDYDIQIVRSGNDFELKKNNIRLATGFSNDISKLVIAGGRVGTEVLPYIQITQLKVRKYAPAEPTILSIGSEEGPFYSVGNYRNPVLDAASKIVLSDILWNPVNQPGSSNLEVSVRVSSHPFSINSSTPSWLTVSNGQNINWHGRYIQYQSTFTTTNSTTTPRLEDISITYRVKPWQEKSVTRTPPNSYGFGGGENWTWQVPVKGGTLVTISAYIRYNTEYQGGSYDKPKLTLSGLGINESISATAGAENSWELRQLSGTPSADGILTLKAEGFSTNLGGKFYIDDINVSQ